MSAVALRLFSTRRNFSLFVSSQAELIGKRQRKIALRAENFAWWKTVFTDLCHVLSAYLETDPQLYKHRCRDLLQTPAEMR